MRKATITVIENTLEQRVFTLHIEITDPKIKTEKQLRNAIKNACKDYVKKTEQGKKNLTYNCGYFNWADFETSVPDHICRTHGFHVVEDPEPGLNFQVDWDEQLIK